MGRNVPTIGSVRKNPLVTTPIQYGPEAGCEYKLLQDTGEGRNKTNNNLVNSAQGAKTSSGECIRTRMTSTPIDITNNDKQDKVLRSTHTEATSSH